MAGKSKLTGEQWADIQSRVLANESIRSIAKLYKIAEGTIRHHKVYAQCAEIKTVAAQVLDVENKIKSLPIHTQCVIFDYAAILRSISNNLAGAADNGARMANTLSLIAVNQVKKINHDDPMESQETLQAISALTKMSNEAAATGLALIKATKDVEPPSDPAQQLRVIGSEEFRQIARDVADKF